MLRPPHDTLAFQAARPAFQNMDWSQAPLKAFAKKAKEFHDQQTDQPVASNVAAQFYLYSQAEAVIGKRFHPLESLPGPELEVMNDRADYINRQARRMFYYVLLICAREARHQKSASKKTDVGMMFDPRIGTFFTQNKLGDIHTAPDKFVTAAPGVTLGVFAKALSWYFYHGNFNGGYGGPAWGKVADCLVDFVHGKLSGEMMVDTAFTLQHNNGPIFNKSMYFEATGHILPVLDVQRSGQMPAFVLKAKEYNHKFPDSVTTSAKKLFELLGEDFMPTAHVDWFKVKALGGLGYYDNFQVDQQAKYGPSEWATKVPAPKAKLNKPPIGKPPSYVPAPPIVIDPKKVYVIPELGTFEKIDMARAA